MQSGSIDYCRSQSASEEGSTGMNSQREKINSPVEEYTPIEPFEEEGGVVVASDDDALNARNKDDNGNR